MAKKPTTSKSRNATAPKRKPAKSEAQIAKEEARKVDLKAHKETIKQARQANKDAGLRGKVRCGKLVHRFDTSGADKNWPTVDGYMNINVCSNAPGIYKNLSPMILGPIYYNTADEGDQTPVVLKAKKLENLWQFAKVWNGERNEISKKPIKAYFDRRKEGWEQEKGQRRVMRGKPLYSYWKGMDLSYSDSRDQIYCPLYEALARKTDAYKQIENLLNDGYNINIIGYDGYDYERETMSLTECFADLSRPFGHELVLCSMLSGEIPWRTRFSEDHFHLTGK